MCFEGVHCEGFNYHYLVLCILEPGGYRMGVQLCMCDNGTDYSEKGHYKYDLSSCPILKRLFVFSFFFGGGGLWLMGQGQQGLPLDKIGIQSIVALPVY